MFANSESGNKTKVIQNKTTTIILVEVTTNAQYKP